MRRALCRRAGVRVKHLVPQEVELGVEVGVGRGLENGMGSSIWPLLRVLDLGQSQPTQSRVELRTNSKLLPHSCELQECERKKSGRNALSSKIQTILPRSVSALWVSRYRGWTGRMKLSRVGRFARSWPLGHCAFGRNSLLHRQFQ